MIEITLPDGSKRTYESGVSGLDVAKSISEGLARNVLAAEVNGEIWDATRPITTNATIKLLTWREADGKMAFWHSSAHLMAEAIQELYPDVKFAIGPPIENGFYYDLDMGEEKLVEADLEKIEKKMSELAKQANEFIRSEVPKEEAIKYFKEKGDPYKLELIDGLEDGNITFYKQGNFTDLCRGPHIPNTKSIKAIKLLNIAGAYWRGDEKNKQLTRIYGVTFPKSSELKEHLALLEEAKKRDHRKLGKELDLFTFSEKVGAGLPLWLPKGAELRERLIEFMRKAQRSSGYQGVVSPHIAHKDLYVCSGHYEKYGEDSFQGIKTPNEGEEFLLKPMNCPHHCEIFASRPRSYKDLPIRFAEFGTVYRYEQSGELHGLTRVRGFTQDDAHLFCTPDQVKDEFKKVIHLIMHVFDSLGFDDFTAQVSLRDQEDRSKYIGSEENWEKAEAAIVEAAKEEGLPYVIEYNEAAFYGPKLDFMVKDAIGRKWQLGTIQVDYTLPERFELEYTGSDNAKHRPVMIHRAPFGSLERFLAILIEHTEGKFPLWLSPEQAIVLPISEKVNDYAQEVSFVLNNSEIRGLVDNRNEKIGKKIREAELKRIPYMLIVGEQEAAEGLVSVRRQGEGDLGTMKIAEFASLVNKEVEKVFEYKPKSNKTQIA